MNGCGTGLYLEKLPPQYQSDGSPGSSGCGSPEIIGAPPTVLGQRITYTWHDIHVHTSGVESRRARLWRKLRGLTGVKKPPPQRKRILHGGLFCFLKLKIFRTLAG